jgi:ABC-type transporter Mla subunit MlaD
VAKQFADAVRASYQAVADRSVSAQALNAQLTQQFFADVINNLRTQAEDTRQMTQQLADQQQRTQEATRTIAQESVGAYMEFLNSMFSFAQGRTQAWDESKSGRAGFREHPPSRQLGE